MTAQPKTSRYIAMKQRWGRIFVAPAMVFIVCFMLIPIISVFFLSFTSWDGISAVQFIGLANYGQIAADRSFWAVIQNNFVFMLLGTPIWTVTPLILAALLYEEIKGFSFFRTIFLFPTVLSASIVGIIFKSFFSFQGPMNTILRAMGLDGLAIDWFASGSTAIPLIVGIMNWAGFGSVVLIFLSAMSSIDPSVYESAVLDGAGWWTRFFKITLPMIYNVTMFVVVLNIISSFTSLFNYIFVMTNGGPGYETTVMEFLIYTKAFRSNQFGYACALAVILFVIVAVLSAVSLYFSRKGDNGN